MNLRCTSIYVRTTSTIKQKSATCEFPIRQHNTYGMQVWDSLLVKIATIAERNSKNSHVTYYFKLIDLNI